MQKGSKPPPNRHSSSVYEKIAGDANQRFKNFNRKKLKIHLKYIFKYLTMKRINCNSRYNIQVLTKVLYPHFQVFYMHDCVTNYKSFCKIEHYMYVLWIREKCYNVNAIVVSLTSFWRWSIGPKHVRDVNNYMQTYKLTTLDGTVSRFIYSD
jgi:hypothetical protein